MRPDVSTGDPSRPAFPFIVGAGRSGTTLLRAMLEAHPHMAIAHESEFVIALNRRRPDYESPSGFAVERFLEDLMGHPWIRREGLPVTLLRARLHEGHPADFADAIRLVFAAFAENRGRPRAGDKTPGYVLAIRLLGRLMPESKFIHIIRDGRDVALSNIERPRGPSNVPEGALFWRRRVKSGRSAGRALGPDRYLEMRYEELVETPERHLRELCRFIDLDFREDMIRFYERADEILASVTTRRQHEHLFHPVQKGLRDWRVKMPAEDVAIFESLAGDVLDELGYERKYSRPPLLARIRALRWRLADPRARRGGRGPFRKTAAG